MGGGELHAVEGATRAEFGHMLDVYAGIDSFRVVRGAGVQGIASRVQYTQQPFASFTVREKRTAGGETELAKRMRALKDRDGLWVVPAFTVQAYVERPRSGRLLYACCIRTPQLFDFIEQHPELLERRLNPADGTQFVVVWVADLLGVGHDVAQFVNDSQPHTRREATVETVMKATLCDRCGVFEAYGYGLCPRCLEDMGIL
jgi:hypothetical protein